MILQVQLVQQDKREEDGKMKQKEQADYNQPGVKLLPVFTVCGCSTDRDLQRNAKAGQFISVYCNEGIETPSTTDQYL